MSLMTMASLTASKMERKRSPRSSCNSPIAPFEQPHHRLDRRRGRCPVPRRTAGAQHGRARSPPLLTATAYRLDAGQRPHHGPPEHEVDGEDQEQIDRHDGPAIEIERRVRSCCSDEARRGQQAHASDALAGENDGPFARRAIRRRERRSRPTARTPSAIADARLHLPGGVDDHRLDRRRLPLACRGSCRSARGRCSRPAAPAPTASSSACAADAAPQPRPLRVAVRTRS